MQKRIVILAFCFVLLLTSIPSTAFATEDGANGCYIATTECPTAYIDYATDNISTYILSLDESISYNNISIGTPFAFADANADVYYFPVICDGDIEYLFRVYPNGDSFSAAITVFLADEIETLAEYTSENNPMYLNLVDTQIVATIGLDTYVLFEYPADMATSGYPIEYSSPSNFSVVNAKSSATIDLNLHQARYTSKYITLDLTEQQGKNSWCTAYCLATIIGTQTNYSATAKGIMSLALGSNPSTSTAFPWVSDNGKTMVSVAKKYGLTPIVLTTTVSNAVLKAEINAGCPCIVAMDRGAGKHSVVLRGYNTAGTWSIWNPWFDYYESYSMTGSYVPTGYSSADYSYTPYMHAYNFG